MSRLKNGMMIGYYDRQKHCMFLRDGISKDEALQVEARFLVLQCMRIADEWGMSDAELEHLVRKATLGDVTLSTSRR